MVKLVPKTWWAKFLFMFSAQFISYFLIVANTRAFTGGYYAWSMVTDWFIGAQTFVQSLVMTKLFVKEDEGFHIWSFLGYTLGGSAGTVASIWVTKHLY